MLFRSIFGIISSLFFLVAFLRDYGCFSSSLVRSSSTQKKQVSGNVDTVRIICRFCYFFATKTTFFSGNFFFFDSQKKIVTQIVRKKKFHISSLRSRGLRRRRTCSVCVIFFVDVRFVLKTNRNYTQRVMPPSSLC